MDGLKDFVLPVLIAMISAGIAALLTIKVKYASTEEEAISKLKDMGGSVLFYLWGAFLIYAIHYEVTSEMPLTRASVFSISALTVSLFSLIVFRIVKSIFGVIHKVLETQGKVLDHQDRHIAITERLKAEADAAKPSKERERSTPSQ